MTDLRAIAHSFPLPSLFPAAQRIGDQRYRVACLSHEEKTPSMIVTYHREHGWRAHCFGCSWDGDAIDVVMALESCTFKEALVKLGAGESIQPPSSLHKRPRMVLVCDMCMAHVEAEEGRYERGGGYVVPAWLEAKARAERMGWRVTSHAAVCDAH